ncbi:MAG TPA: prepilin peptidase [Candidatus Paceibacterota bacterium]|jgi:prepilin signal peptidase PulO-like enzyme (type II secretory pathway)|nr:prepilin peptidase [Candidatus Paceibacterota bacterium]
MFLSALCFGLFGAIIGSFLNVIVLRHGVKTMFGRSACASCAHELEAVDLVPIISWLALGGKCRFCGSKISIQYPLIEVGTAILFGCIGAAPLALPLQLLALPVVALFVAISAYDIRHGIIPDSWVASLAGFSLFFSFVYITVNHEQGAFTAFFLAGPASALPFAALWFVSKGRWMGLGDAKLAWAIGWLLGPLYAFATIVAAFVLGAAVSVCILLPLSSPKFRDLLRRFTPTRSSRMLSWGFTMKSEVAFGPFLAAACLILWLMLLFGHDPLAYLYAGLP